MKKFATKIYVSLIDIFMISIKDTFNRYHKDSNINVFHDDGDSY